VKPVLIQTRDHRAVTVSVDQVVEFTRPVLGFEEYRHYALYPAPGAPPFYWLQCIQERGLAFPVVRAEELSVTYRADAEVLRCLRAQRPEEVTYWVIVALPEDGGAAHVNLRAPVIVNRATRLAAQVIMREEYPVSAELPSRAGELVGAR
jgi:flagellar assembly factor FliW